MFLDPNLKFKKNTLENRIQLYKYKNLSLPLPTEVEISESGTCNRKCIFCPRSDPNFIDKKEFISQNLHTKLCIELKSINYSGTIRYSGFVEPLIDKNIYNLIKEVRNYLPSSNIELVTNGDPLNAERLKKLFSNGLNRILISAYDDKKNAEQLEKLCLELKLNKDQFIVRHRYLPENQDFGISLSNRAGQMANAEYKIAPLKEPLKKKCYIPSYSFFLDYQGDVLICGHDWGKKIILGNLNNESFLDIWFSKKAMTVRKQLNNSNRNFAPCNVCDVNGTLIGKKNSDLFIK